MDSNSLITTIAGFAFVLVAAGLTYFAKTRKGALVCLILGCFLLAAVGGHEVLRRLEPHDANAAKQATQPMMPIEKDLPDNASSDRRTAKDSKVSASLRPRIKVTSPQPSPIQNAQNGGINIAQKSDGPNSPNTVLINQRVQPRRVSPEKQAWAVTVLSRQRATVGISAIMNNSEAFRFAQDLYDVFKAAGWTMKDRGPLVFMRMGGTSAGLVVAARGTPVAPGGNINVSANSPMGEMAELFHGLGVAHFAQLHPDLPEGEYQIEVSEQPNPE